MLATTLVVTYLASADVIGWLTVALPLVVGMGAVYAFRPARLFQWIERGWLPAADALLVGLALFGADPRRSLPLLGFLAALLAGVFLADGVRATIAAGALACALLAVSVSVPAIGLRPDAVIAAALVQQLTAGLAFGMTFARIRPATRRADFERQGTSEQWALLDITETIGSTLDVTQVMRSIVKHVGDLMSVESCSILVLDEQLGGCFVVASKGYPDVDMLEVDLGKYPEVRRALETREPVLVKDVASHPLLASVRKALLEKGFRSLLVVPLLYGREVLGTLFLRTRRENPFSPDDIRFCKLAAGASANALKNALLYREVATEAERNRATGEKLRRVLDGTPDMIVATDDEDCVVEFNRGAEEMIGWSAERARGRRLSEILGVELDAGSSSRVGDDRFYDVVFRRFDGTQLEISLSRAPLMGADGEAAGRVWIGRDVTKLRRVEKSLAQAERLSSLGEVVAGVAHELNNPLSGVVGYAELLRMHAAREDQVRDLDRIVESAMRCQKIVLKLLSFARKHPPEKKSHDLNDCVRKVLDLKSYQLHSSQIETRLELAEGLPPTCFDFHQIEQVILNLINNAEQAIASIRAPGQIVLRTSCVGDELRVEVEDNGPGIPRAIRDRVFDPFFTTKELGQGTGLGLAVSYGIVNEHGGRIELHEGGGESGCRFVVHLPLVEGVPQREPTPEPGSARNIDAMRERRVLVVEDDPVVAELLARVLREDGADVVLAADGAEALKRIDEQEFDLIVADLRMPNVDGRELYEQVAAERPDLLRRMVFATGDLIRPETVAFLENLPNRFLTKPLQIETVRRVLSQAMRTQASRPVRVRRDGAAV